MLAEQMITRVEFMHS